MTSYHPRVSRVVVIISMTLGCAIGMQFAGCGRASDLGSYRLAVAVQHETNTDIFVMDGEGRIVEQVTDTPQKSEMWPMWDPHGRVLYYEIRDQGTNQLILAKRTLGSEREDTLYMRAEKGALWFALSADGRKLVYLAKDSLWTHLDVLDLETGFTQTLNREDEQLLRPEWAPDSRLLLAQIKTTGDAGPWDLTVIDTETGERMAPLPSGDRTRFKARWAYDAGSVVYSVAHDGLRRRVGLHIARIGESRETILVDGNDERIISGVWSSQGAVAALRERPLPLAVLIWPNPWQSVEPIVAELDEAPTRGRIVWSHDGQYIAANVANRRRGHREGWTMIVLDRKGRIVRKWDDDLNVICPAWAPSRALESNEERNNATS